MTQLTVTPELNQFVYGTRSARFLVRIVPAPAPSERAPLRLVLALDVSGSMNGEPIESARTAAKGVAHALGGQDQLGIVTFANAVKVVSGLQRMGPTAAAGTCALLDRMSANGGTDLAGGMLAALELVNGAGPGGRVLLLTDGQPTAGVRDGNAILELCRRHRGGAALSTFGFGRGVDAQLLGSLADTGTGGYTFIEGGETPVEAIGAELGGALATVAFDVHLTLKLDGEAQIEHLSRTAGKAELHGASAELSLAPLVAEEPVDLVVTLSWPGAIAAPNPANAGEPQSVALGRLVLSYRHAQTGDKHTVSVPISAAFAAVDGARDREVAKAMLLATAADALLLEDDVRLAAAAKHLRERAEEWQLSAAPEVVAALELVDWALRAGRSQGAEQDKYAMSRALYSKRQTSTGTAVRTAGTRAQESGKEQLRAAIQRSQRSGGSGTDGEGDAK